MPTNTYRDEDSVAIGQAARILGVSVSTVRRWEDAGALKSTRTLGNQRRYRVGDLLALLERGAA